MVTQDLAQRLAVAQYVADAPLVAALRLLVDMKRPLLMEGDAGVGKTEVAKALAAVFACPLIRLQCHEGLDVNSAVYEWNYQRQLLAIQMAAVRGGIEEEDSLFSREFLLKRPLLQAIDADGPVVLLIDEVDRADEEFEAYLLEALSDFQITIPEFGTVRARTIPYVVLTSNGTRELSDALRRRCLYYYLEYPSRDKEQAIVNCRLPGISARLAGEVVGFVQSLRGLDLRKMPGISETLDWAAALMSLGVVDLDHVEDLEHTLICLLKTQEDRNAVGPDIVRKLVGLGH
ncbi:MAG: AAA family ATPase [Acidiferrobacter sp.]